MSTNIHLKQLLKAHLGLSLRDTYATNLFPFVKPGAMNANIPSKNLIQAAKEFTLPMIDIIQPRLVICLGLNTFNGIGKALGFKSQPNMAAAIDNPW